MVGRCGGMTVRRCPGRQFRKAVEVVIESGEVVVPQERIEEFSY